MQQVKNNIGYIILAIAAIVIVVVAWFKATPASAPTVDQPTTSTVQRETELPDFAYIEERNGERVLVNERDGYELVLEENWVPEYYTNVVEVILKDEYPSGELTASFSVIVNPQNNLSLEKWTERWLLLVSENCKNCYENKGVLEIGDLRVMKIFDKVGLGGNRYNYLFVKNENFYSINTANMDEEKVFSIISKL